MTLRFMRLSNLENDNPQRMITECKNNEEVFGKLY